MSVPAVQLFRPDDEEPRRSEYLRACHPTPRLPGPEQPELFPPRQAEFPFVRDTPTLAEVIDQYLDRGLCRAVKSEAARAERRRILGQFGREHGGRRCSERGLADLLETWIERQSGWKSDSTRSERGQGDQGRVRLGGREAGAAPPRTRSPSPRRREAPPRREVTLAEFIRRCGTATGSTAGRGSSCAAGPAAGGVVACSTGR